MNSKAKSRKPKWLRIIDSLATFLLVALFAGWIVSEIRWAKINSPDGRFENVKEYLSIGRLPGQVTKVEKNGETYWIAHAPADYWLAIPSSPPAYIFNKAGRLVESCSDPGDNDSFQEKWLGKEKQSSIDKLEKLGVQ